MSFYEIRKKNAPLVLRRAEANELTGRVESTKRTESLSDQKAALALRMKLLPGEFCPEP